MTEEISKNSDCMFDDSTFEDAFDEVIRLARKAKVAEVDAACCQTSRDFDVMRSAQENASGARDAFLARFGADVATVEHLRSQVTALSSALRDVTAKLRAA